MKAKEDKIKNIAKRMIFEVKKRLISREYQEIINKFHKIYYNLGIWQFTEWRGYKIFKYPSDIFLYTNIIFKNKPDLIIETGTLFGGSALLYADILNIIGKGKVISIDNVKRKLPKHKRIKYIVSDSTDSSLISKLKEECKNKKTIVILDSDHHKSHVLKEMELYGELVSKGQYLIVEDSNINNHPVYPSFGEGPYEAIEEFIAQNSDFKIDKRIETKFLFTANVNGFLKKV